MKYNNLRAFEKHLMDSDAKHLSPVYMVLSKESFERKIATDLLVKTLFKSLKNPELALKTFNAADFKMDALMHELNALPFFSEKRVILLQNADALSKKETAQLENYFARPNTTLCLIIVAETINRATNFYKNAEKAGIILDIAEEKPWEKEKSLREWIPAKVISAGRQIEPAAVQLLLKQIGTDQALLTQEIEKLYCYLGERKEITAADVAAICVSVHLENAWQLCEAILARNPKDSLRIAKGLLMDGSALIAVLRQIRSQMQTDYQICSILEGGGTSVDVSTQFPHLRGFILDKRINGARAYSLNRFKKAMLLIDKTESLAKSSQGSDDFLLEMLIIKLVS